MGYIEREALPKRKERGFFLDDDFNAGWNACLNNINSIPVADVRPVERGVWRKIKYRSICRDCSFRGFASWKYCPNCGRQMTTEGDNG